MPLNLKSRKIEIIKCMLNLNNSVTKTINYEKLWKVLICDKTGLDIISTLITKNEIKDIGVTLTLKLNTEREAIADAPAIYFILPTTENIGRICKDIENGLYENYYLNFISPVNREKLESIAYSAYRSDSVSHVSKIFDQYINFICLDDDLFVLVSDAVDPVYLSLNRPGQTIKDIDLIINGIVDGLFSVCVALGTVPIIRCPPGKAAEMVAQRLDKKIRDNLRDTRNTLFSGLGGVSNFSVNSSGLPATQLSFERPVLVLLDREMDLATPLHHPWTYQALVNDILGLKNKSVKIPSSGGSSSSGRSTWQSYDLWSENDEFWREERHKPLPEIADVIQQQLELIKSKDKEIAQLKSKMNAADVADGDTTATVADNTDFADSTVKLGETVSSLGEILKKKKLIEVHTNIATYLVDQIKERKLDMYFELEEKMQAKQQLQDKSVLDVLSGPEGTANDKLRLLLLSILYETGSSSIGSGAAGVGSVEQEIDQLAEMVEKMGNTEAKAAIKYIRTCQAHAKFAASGSGVSKQSGGGSGGGGSSLFTKFMSHGHAYIMEGVKSFVAKKHKLPFTKIVHNLMEQISDPETDAFKYYDPRLYRYNEGDTIPRHKAPYHEAIVFVIGGGNYIEYQNLVEYCRSSNSSSSNTVPIYGQSSKRICYGSTEMLTAEQFVSQLAQLGNQ